jgi:hypothetical protein
VAPTDSCNPNPKSKIQRLRLCEAGWFFASRISEVTATRYNRAKARRAGFPVLGRRFQSREAKNHPVRRSGGHPSFVRRGIFFVSKVFHKTGCFQLSGVEVQVFYVRNPKSKIEKFSRNGIFPVEPIESG